jgi:hypothetical protein
MQLPISTGALRSSGNALQGRWQEIEIQHLGPTQAAPCFNPEGFAAANSWTKMKPFSCWLGTNACMRELTPDMVYHIVQAQAIELRGLSQSSSSDRLL